jgi:hypothetical protein
MGKSGNFEKLVKFVLFEETLDALVGFDPDTDDANKLVAALGGMYVIAAKIMKKMDAKTDLEEAFDMKKMEDDE